MSLACFHVSVAKCLFLSLIYANNVLPPKKTYIFPTSYVLLSEQGKEQGSDPSPSLCRPENTGIHLKHGQEDLTLPSLEVFKPSAFFEPIDLRFVVCALHFSVVVPIVLPFLQQISNCVNCSVT